MKFDKGVIWLRIIACYMVILNHTFGQLLDIEKLSVNWILSCVVVVISKSAVPIFLMISGSLSLNKEISYTKNTMAILKMVMVLLLFSLLYYRFDPLNSYRELGSFFNNFFSLPITNAFWYMYAYIAIMIFRPFIHKMIENFRSKDYYVFFTVSLFFTSLIPLLEKVSGKVLLSPRFTINLFSIYIVYYVFGHYVRNFLEKITRKMFINACITFISVTIFTVVMMIHTKSQGVVKFTIWDSEGVGLNIAVPAMCLMIIFRYLYENKQTSNSALIIISKATFGVYLFSDLLIHRYTPLFYNNLLVTLKPFNRMLIFSVLVLLAGLIVTVLYYQIKDRLGKRVKSVISR